MFSADDTVLVIVIMLFEFAMIALEFVVTLLNVVEIAFESVLTLFGSIDSFKFRSY